MGAVALVDRGSGEPEVAVAGHHDLDRARSMARDSIFRIASLTKPMTAALVMTLVEEGRLRLDDPVARWLPEIAAPLVVRTPTSPVDDLVPVVRPITVEHLLTMTAGWGWASDFEAPAVGVLADRIERQGEPHEPRTPDEWLRDLAAVPLLHQPGDAWLYNTCSDLQGVLVARVLDRPLPDAFEERLLGPLAMADTGFAVPDTKAGRLAGMYRAGADGTLAALAEPVGSYRELPGFASGAGGLVSTVDDVHTFFRMIRGAGEVGGVRVLRPETVRAMTTNQISVAQGEAAQLFLDGQGWGYGGGVDVAAGEAWVVPGRYGWVGGTGTAGYVVPDSGVVSVLLTQRAMGGPDDAVLLGDFCTYAAERATG
ncbi:MAG: serine hydrolase [Nocardioidaceae bacterium]|nr:serine hydrolase [Nocardioidaceae bacterium]